MFTLEAIAFLFLIIISHEAQASHSGCCDATTREAGRKTGVPVTILLALTRAETGRQMESYFKPGAWTAHVDVKDRWFEELYIAQGFAAGRLALGWRCVSIGCFLINYQWHGSSFNSVRNTLHPKLNSRYAAKFLNRPRRETGYLTDAIASYHSRSPKQSNKFVSRFSRTHCKLRSQTKSFDDLKEELFKRRRAARITDIDYPLLTGGDAHDAAASLVLLSGPRKIRLVTHSSNPVSLVQIPDQIQG